MNTDDDWGFIDLVLTICLGILGMVLTLPFLWTKFGLVGVILGTVLFPITFVVVPAWIFFTTGSPWPALVCYVGSIVVLKGRRWWGSWM